MIVVISGPSGVGKTTLVQTLITSSNLPLRRAITCTTRSPRKGERHAIDYYFASEGEFKAGVLSGEFAEVAAVHGHHYGTPISELKPSDDEIIILIIDVHGFRQIRESHKVISFFIITSEYKERLIKRKTEDREGIKIRLETAEEELKSISEYDHVIVNDEITEAIVEMEGIISRERRTN